ncbi:MAG: hypothetical protein IKE53_01250 [Clostridiales bacterium]|nr:hypothetical protein [Clostridiales bacterium]
MKRSIIIAVSLAAALALAGCSSGEEQTDPVNIGGQTTITVPGDGGEASVSSDSYKFTYSGTTVQVNTDVSAALAAFGDDYTYYESNSCAYQGLDKIYTYPLFVIYTYPDGDRDMISSVEVKADVISTEEGIRIGSSRDDVTAAYGDDYQDAGSVIKYTKGESVLSFVFENDEVSGIVYDYANLRTE